MILVFFSIFNTSAQTVVNSLADLLPYLDDDNANVKLAPGTYEINEYDVTNFLGKYSNPLLLFSGNNSTYDFTDVTININTIIFQKLGSVDVKRAPNIRK